MQTHTNKVDTGVSEEGSLLDITIFDIYSIYIM